jgi:predicted Fe-S protein YdhL (DUF1289 family)
VSAVPLRAKCPTCGAVRDAQASGDGYAMQEHPHPSFESGWGPQFCAGGDVTVANVLAWTKVARDEKDEAAARVEAQRETVRAELARSLASLDANEAAFRTSVAAYDRAIARIEKKVTK